MTDVRNDDYTLIASIDDVLPLYQGNGLPAARQTIGMETEICLYREDAEGRLTGATARECADLVEHLKQTTHHQPQLEMASAIEYASPAFRVTEINRLCEEIQGAWFDFHDAIARAGLQAHDGALLPFATVDSAKEVLVDRDRARGLVKGMGEQKAPEFLKVTLLCTSTQVSLSYRDADDLYDTMNTAYALIPAIYALFANHPAYIEGGVDATTFNPRARFYEAFGKDGGIPDSLLKAKNGQELIRNHAQQVFENEMLFYYDTERNIIWPERPVRFCDLEALGLNTRSNYDLAESFVYNDLKICNIRDEDGVATGKRVEVRSLDAGALGVFAGIPFIHAVLRDEATNAAVKGLLMEYGMTPDQDGFGARLLAARSAVANHGGKFLDVPFGFGSLADFSRDLGQILSRHAQRHPQLADSLAPLVEICETGVTQAERTARATADYAHANLRLSQNHALAVSSLVKPPEPGHRFGK